MYNLVEKDRFERLKVNGELPDHVAEKSANALMKRPDCTKQMTEMLETFRDNLVDTRDRPSMPEDIPTPME